MGNLKGVLILLLIAGGIFLAVKLTPPFISNYNLHEDVDNMVLQYTYAQNASADAIQAAVIAKAKEHDIELVEDNVKVERTQMGVQVDVNYHAAVNLPGRVVNLPFDFHSGNKNITAK